MGTANAAVELLQRNLKRHPDKVAYFCGNRVLTYRGLDLACRRFARLLRTLGIAPGERVVIALPDCFAFPVTFLGCLLTGAMAVAAGSALRDEDLAHVVGDSGARLLVSHADQASRHAAICSGVAQIACDDQGHCKVSALSTASDAPYHPAADDFAYMLYSSGSTGRPKGIPHRHKSLLLPCELVGSGVLGIRGTDVIFSTSKLSFCYGLINSLSFPLHFGASAVLNPGKPDMPAILALIGQHRPTVFFSVPTVYRQIALNCAEPELKLTMRLCCSAGEQLPALLFEEWRRLTGLEIIDGIGASELSHHFICNVPGRAVAGSAGRVVPGYRVRLVNDDG
ncbi:MAG TPA: AMP-binding protein, partial [Geobacteraceae bacterium]|nr:AMP-binding protein [Geobacteraceae bacterium]